MRPDGDHRQDHIIKREIFDEHIRDFYDVKLCLDDRKQCAELWHGLGLRTWRVSQDDTY